jgi:hypothetical protein
MVEQRNDAFWQQSLSRVFLDTLETYSKYIRDKKIPYYWNDEYNLIGHIDDTGLYFNKLLITLIIHHFLNLHNFQ